MVSIATLMTGSFPKEMTSVPLWLNYRLIDRGNGKFSKPPVSPFTGEVCSKTDAGMYTDFERALLGVEQHNTDGLGFVLLHGFIAIDLDNCFQDNGELTEMASDIVDHFLPTYIEYSPSGNGLHIYCQGNKPNNRTRVNGIEVYSGANFITVTGDKVDESGDKVLNMQPQLEWLFETYLPTQDSPVKTQLIYVDHGSKSPSEWLEVGLSHDDKLYRLYSDTDHLDDESGHDLSLLCKLAYWLNRDTDAITKVFFESPWVQSKDRVHINKLDKRADYFDRTLTKALTITTNCAALNERKTKNISEGSLRLAETASGEIVLPLEDYTDVANARAFAEVYKEELAFTEEFGWCYFTGLNWELGKAYYAQDCAVEFAENIMYVAKQYYEMFLAKCEAEGCTPTSKTGKELMSGANLFMAHAKKTNSERGVRAILKLAESIMKVPASAFDGNPWILNTPNVVVDLRTGETYPPAWNHYNSLMTTLPYDENAKSSGMWESFLCQIFCEDEKLIDYIQVRLGAACVGKVYEENLMIATGTGSNGKSTMFNVLKAILGDYCCNVNPDVLMDKGGYEQQIAAVQLKGKRLAIGQETESGQKLSTASVKRLVSSDTMVGRVLNHGYVEFTPSHTLMLATNHLPKVSDNDEGTWRRLTVVPFNATITRDNMITNYQDVLLAEDGSYILKWLVDGAIRFYEQGCTFGIAPIAVHHATTEYKAAQKDTFDCFCDAEIEFVDPMRHPKAWCSPNEVYSVYLTWCEENNLKPYSKIVLSRKLGQKGMVSKKARLADNTIATVWTRILLKKNMIPAIEG